MFKIDDKVTIKNVSDSSSTIVGISNAIGKPLYLLRDRKYGRLLRYFSENEIEMDYEGSIGLRRVSDSNDRI